MIKKGKLQILVPLLLVFALLVPCAAEVHVRWNFNKGNGGIYQAGESGKLYVWIENAIEENSKGIDESRYVRNIKVNVQYPTGIEGTTSNFYPATLAPGEVGPTLTHTFSISPDAEQAVYSFKIKVWYDQNYTDPYKPKCCQTINIMNNYLEVNGDHGEQTNCIRVQRVAEKVNLTQIGNKLDDVSKSLQTVENELKIRPEPTQGITIYDEPVVGTGTQKMSLISSAGAIISSVGSVVSAVIVGILSVISSTIFVSGALLSAGLLSIAVIIAVVSMLLSVALLLVLIFVVILIVDFLIILFVIWLVIRIFQHSSKKKK